MIEWLVVTKDALLRLWRGFVDFIPELIGAIIVFIIGWFISVIIGKMVAGILRKIKFNMLFERGGWKEALEKAEIKVDPSGFIGAIFKWILVIVFLLASVEILGLDQFANFLREVLTYLPNVIVAVLIFVVAVIIADIIEKVVRASAESVKIGYGKMAGAIVKWAIWIFAIMLILMQLGIGRELIHTLFIGFVGLVAIGGGIAFGLGGKDLAREALQTLRDKIKKE